MSITLNNSRNLTPLLLLFSYLLLSLVSFLLVPCVYKVYCSGSLFRIQSMQSGTLYLVFRSFETSAKYNNNNLQAKSLGDLHLTNSPLVIIIDPGHVIQCYTLIRPSRYSLISFCSNRRWCVFGGNPLEALY